MQKLQLKIGKLYRLSYYDDDFEVDVINSNYNYINCIRIKRYEVMLCLDTKYYNIAHPRIWRLEGYKFLYEDQIILIPATDIDFLHEINEK